MGIEPRPLLTAGRKSYKRVPQCLYWQTPSDRHIQNTGNSGPNEAGYRLFMPWCLTLQPSFFALSLRV